MDKTLLDEITLFCSEMDEFIALARNRMVTRDQCREALRLIRRVNYLAAMSSIPMDHIFEVYLDEVANNMPAMVQHA